MARGVPSLESQGDQGRVLSDTAIWVPNSLSQVDLARGPPDREYSGNPVATSGGMLVCLRWQPNLLVGSVTALASTLASRPFFERAVWGDQPPAHLKVWLFLIFFIDLFYSLFEGFGLLALILALFLSAQKCRSGKKKKSCFSAYWLRSSARVLFCAFI